MTDTHANLFGSCSNEDWEMFLYICNNTGQDLTATHPSEPAWGLWYRDSTDDKAPMDIPAGKSVQALGVRASNGTWTGYECKCNWNLPNNLGSVEFFIDVPFSASNSSHIVSTGDLIVEGWWPIGKSGHRFSRTITISSLNNLVELENIEHQTDNDSRRYNELLLSNNEMMENWDKLKNGVKEMEQFDPLTFLPSQYLYPPREIFAGRTAPLTIQRKYWNNIEDPRYKEYWQKDRMVEEYFAVEVYSINTNARCTQSIPAGMRTITESTVEVTSSIKTTLETNMSIRSLLRAEHSGVAAELETTYSIKNILEESTGRIERDVKTIEISESSKNRIFVPWMISKVVAIYRRKKDKTVSLVAISEWADEIFDKVYEH